MNAVDESPPGDPDYAAEQPLGEPWLAPGETVETGTSAPARAMRCFALGACGRHDEALALAPDGPWGALVRGRGAYAHRRLDEALAHLAEAERDPDTRVLALENAAIAVMLCDSPAAAIPRFQTALDAAEVALPPDHAVVGEIAACLGDCLLQEYESAAADILERATRILARAFGPVHAVAVDARDHWRAALTQQHRPFPGDVLAPVGFDGPDAATPARTAGAPITAARLADVRTLARFRAKAEDCTLAPDGRLVIAHADGISLVDPTTLAEQRIAVGEMFTACACADLVVGHNDSPPVVFTADGAFVRELPGYSPGWLRPLDHARATSCRYVVPVDGRAPTELPIEPCGAVIPSPTGRYLAYRDDPDRLHVFDTESGRDETRAKTAAFAWGGDTPDDLATTDDCAVLYRGARIRTVHEESVYRIAISPARDVLYTTSYDGTIALVDVASRDTRAQLPDPERGMIVELIATERVVVSRTYDGVLRVHGIPSTDVARPLPEGACARFGPAESTTTPPPCALSLAVCGERVAVAFEGRTVLDGEPELAGTRAIGFAPDGTFVRGADEGLVAGALEVRCGRPASFAFSPDGARVAVVGEGFVAVLAWPSGERLRDLPPTPSSPKPIAWSPDGRWIAYPDQTTVVLHDLQTSVTRVLEDHGLAAAAVALSATHLATAGRDRSVLIYELPSVTLRHRLEGHTQPVSSLAFSRDGAMLASAGTSYEPGGVRAWDPHAGLPLARWHVDDKIGCVTFSDDRLYVAGERPDVLAYPIAWIASRERPPIAPPRARTHALAAHEDRVAVWGSERSFDGHEVIDSWDEDWAETVDVAYLAHKDPALGAAVARACAEHGLDSPTLFTLYRRTWDADVGPCPRAPEIVYLGSFPVTRRS